MRELVGSRLKEERERLLLSQAAMAESSGASRRAVFAWETGETTPGADALARLAEAGFDVLYVVTGRRTPRASSALTPDEAALLRAYAGADEAARAALRLLAERVGGNVPAGRK